MVHEISLINTEIEVAKLIAQKRIETNRSANIINTPYAGYPQEKLDEHAAGAELAFCKFMNLYPDLTTHIRSGGPDCIYNGARFDVKNTRHANGWLVVKACKNINDCDAYVLVTGMLPDYKIVGYMKSIDVFDQKYRHIHHWIHTDQKLDDPSYAIPQVKLTAFDIKIR